jgi:hypothetical protein
MKVAESMFAKIPISLYSTLSIVSRVASKSTLRERHYNVINDSKLRFQHGLNPIDVYSSFSNHPIYRMNGFQYP